MSKRFFANPLVAAAVFLITVLVISVAKATEPRITVPPNFTAPQEQASTLAVPPQGPAPASALAVVLCNSLVGLVVIDDNGTIHPVPLKGMTKESVNAVLALVPAAKTISMNIGCPSNASKDVTVL